MKRNLNGFSANLFLCFMVAIVFSCGGGGGGGGDDPVVPDRSGDAVIGLTIADGGFSSTPPAVPQGYTLLPIDINAGYSLGPLAYVWLYYKMGPADGSQGAPLAEIYTVNQNDGETPLDPNDVQVPVSVDGNNRTSPIWLYYRTATENDPVVRCVVVANQSKGITAYGPPEAEGRYRVVWVEELDPDSWKTPEEYPQPADAQDLNEGQLGDWIFIGYCTD